MTVHILRITANYSDEFDVMGIHELSLEAATYLVGTQGSCFESVEEYFFGTNEGIAVEDMSFELDTLTEEEYKAAKKALGCSGKLAYGLIDMTDFIAEAMVEG